MHMLEYMCITLLCSFMIVNNGEVHMGTLQSKVKMSMVFISVIYFILVSLGSYNSVYLQNEGFTVSQVGTITAILSFLGFVVTPIFGSVSDKAKSYKSVIRALLMMTAVLSFLVYLLDGQYLYSISMGVIFLIISNVFKSPVGALIENYLMVLGEENHVDYGFTRGLGSFSFAIASIVLGFVVPLIRVEFLFVLSALVCILLFCTVNLSSKKKSAEKGNSQIGNLLKNRDFIYCLLFSFFIYISANCCFTFLPYLLSEIGENSGSVGIAVGYGALVEVPVIIVTKLLSKKISIKKLFAMSGFLYFFECLFYYLSRSLFTIVAIASTIRGFAHGLFVAAGNQYVFSLAEDNQKATAMSLYTSMGLVAGMLGNVVGGRIIDTYSAKIYFLAVGTSNLLIFIWFLTRKMNNKLKSN